MSLSREERERMRQNAAGSELAYSVNCLLAALEAVEAEAAGIREELRKATVDCLAAEAERDAALEVAATAREYGIAALQSRDALQEALRPFVSASPFYVCSLRVRGCQCAVCRALVALAASEGKS